MRKNTSGQVIGAQLVSATDGSAFTGAVTVYVTGDGGTQAAGSVGSGACTHEGNGYHSYAPAQAETNYDHIAFTFTGAGAVPATVQVFTDYPQTGDSYARIGAPVGASLSADIAVVDGNVDAILVDTGTTLEGHLTDIKGGTFSGATDSLEAIRDRGDAAWTAPTAAAIRTEIDSNSTQLAAIVADTNELQTDWVNGGRLDLILDARASQTSVDTVAGYIDTEVAAIKAKTDNLPASPAATGDIPSAASIADAVWDEATLGHTTAGTFGEQVKTDVDAILADTNELQADWANGGRLDLILDARAAQTTADAIEADTQDIQSRLPAALTGGGNIKADVIAISSSTAAADNLEAHALRAISVTFNTGGSTTTAVFVNVDGAAASSTNDVYNGRVLIFGAPAALKDQACSITDYDGATKTATISAVTAAVSSDAAAVMV